MGGSMIDTLAAGGMKAYGQLFQGETEHDAYRYNAAVARENARAAQQNVELAAESGDVQAGMVGLRGRSNYNETKAQQGASGLDVNKGSGVDVRASERSLNEVDMANTRMNSVREAYGYQVKEAQFKGEAALDKYQGQVAETAGEIGAAGTIIGTLGEEDSQFMQYLQMGGMAG